MTTETDRELLELAAKAAGITSTSRTIDGAFWIPEGAECQRPWNPLTDDGDALRLAVKLGLFAEYDAASQLQAISEVPGADPYADTRRAIVRAAAEIGKNLP